MIKLTKYKQVEKGGKKPQSIQRTQRKVSGINYQVLVHLNHPWKSVMISVIRVTIPSAKIRLICVYLRPLTAFRVADCYWDLP
jgi:hypothetical protein